MQDKTKKIWLSISSILALCLVCLLLGGLVGYSQPWTSADNESQITPPSEPAKPTDEAKKTEEKMTTQADLTPDSNGLSKAVAIIKTKYGNIVFKFYPEDAPETVKRIIQLIQEGFYNGLTFHRVEPGFVIQGGDPKGNGTGGSGVNLKAEFNDKQHIEGTVAMARSSDPDSADSQFYITLGRFPHLDHKYTVFGLVVSGVDVVRKIRPGDQMLEVTLSNEH